MRYSLDLKMIGDKSYLESIEDELPQKDDEIVDSELYNTPIYTEAPDGRTALTGMIRFIKDADRETAEQAILDLSGTFDKAEVGSVLKLHTCYHDQDPPKPCEATTIYEVVEE